MIVNWFGVRGKVGVAPVPHARIRRAGNFVEKIYWLLLIPKNAIHGEFAWRFLRHCAGPEMVKLLTLEGGIGCQKSTFWRGVRDAYTTGARQAKSRLTITQFNRKLSSFN
jgi:multiple sugar transport system substrate-binding protein